MMGENLKTPHWQKLKKNILFCGDNKQYQGSRVIQAPWSIISSVDLCVAPITPEMYIFIHVAPAVRDQDV